ncbi:MAG: phosphate ABC transporter ATP-binding protein [Acidimicrobiales bacterium]|nr:phosphate ABC transporter ATP-binding protein [Acidimicrobiales bacterium]
MSLFLFDRVVVAFDGVTVLAGVDAAIADGGHITCLLGPSGSGKSTMLRLCNRLEVPTQGCVRFRGDDIGDADPLRLRRRVGMVFQRPTVFPGTVRDNLLVAQPDASGVDCEQILERTHVDPRLLDRNADALSGGEAQRVCLARTLITGPEVLLMDEPTSALDPAATRGLEELASELTQDGMPIVWVTHDLEQAGRIADDRIVLANGRVADDHETGHYFAGEDAGHHHAENDDG